MLQILNLTMTAINDRRELLHDFSMTLNRGDKAAVIGEEGNGKSTLLKWIRDPSSVTGYCEVSGQCICRERTGYLPQEFPAEYNALTVHEYFQRLEAFDPADSAGLNRLAVRLGIDPDFFISTQLCGTLSGGEKIRMELAGILLGRPGILLLDEPSNDLDIETLVWLETMIRDFPGIVLYISHDEVLLENTANMIIHLELLKRKQESRSTVMRLSYREYARQRAEAIERQRRLAVSDRREDAKRQEKYSRIMQKVQNDLRSVSRQDPHGGRLLKKKMKSVKSMGRRFEREREEMTEMPVYEEAILFSFDENTRVPAGKKVLEYRQEYLQAPNGRILAENIEMTVFGPEHICVTGRNGSGKTTLLKELYETLKEQSNLRIGYMPQNYEDLLDLSVTASDFLCGRGTKEEVTLARQYLGAMRFTPEEMERPLRELSGGQKAKILFLKMNLEKAEVLMLDEPTRNFSPLSAPVIRQMLKAFHGCIIAVSHDRRFIEETADRILVLSEKGLRVISSIRNKK